MNATMQFQRASRTQLKARVALIGPSGSGKTLTALKIAQGLEGRVAVIDTENGSASVYSDEFEFDVLRLDTFSPETYVQAIHAAETAGYNVLIIDSLSHAWMGKEGVLEIVDREAARAHGNTFGVGWKAATPKHNALINAMVRCQCHLIVTMRAKTDYVQEKNDQGRTVVRKIGLAPVQRDGMEYEFDVAGDMDANNRLIITKSRCRVLSGAVIEKPGPELGKQILVWLQDGTPDTDRMTAGAMPAKETEVAPSEAPAVSNRQTTLVPPAISRILDHFVALQWTGANTKLWMHKFIGKDRVEDLTSDEQERVLHELEGLLTSGRTGVPA